MIHLSQRFSRRAALLLAFLLFGGLTVFNRWAWPASEPMELCPWRCRPAIRRSRQRRRLTSALQAARNVIRPNTGTGRVRSTPRRCSPPPSRPCSAISRTLRSLTPALPPPSSGATANSWCAPTGRTGNCRTTRSPTPWLNLAATALNPGVLQAAKPATGSAPTPPRHPPLTANLELCARCHSRRGQFLGRVHVW